MFQLVLYKSNHVTELMVISNEMIYSLFLWCSTITVTMICISGCMGQRFFMQQKIAVEFLVTKVFFKQR